MRQQSLKDWGYAEELYSNEDVEIISELSGFGKPRRGSSMLDLITGATLKLALLCGLLLCIAAMGFCVYKIGTSIKPALQQVICEAPAVKGK